MDLWTLNFQNIASGNSNPILHFGVAASEARREQYDLMSIKDIHNTPLIRHFS